MDIGKYLLMRNVPKSRKFNFKVKGVFKVKKVFSVLLALLFCFGLCACNDQEVDLVQERKDRLNQAYELYWEYTDFAELSSDNSVLTIETKPTIYTGNDKAQEGEEKIEYTNNYLNLPASINEKISMTRPIDGMQSQNCGDFTVTWNYYGNHSFDIIYEVNFS